MPSLGKHTPRGWLSRYIFAYVGTISLFLARMAASSPLPNVKHYSGPMSTQFYALRKTYGLQVAAAACAAVSMAASFIAFYWFCRMQKLFRHRLIMLLIYGDLMKASWLFLFGVVSIARGTVYTDSAFCQASGFLVQYGTETSDYAVLLIAIHSALQVFRPSNTVRSDGLYPYRHVLYFGALVIPGTMAGLAFINPHGGYVSQGGFCTLPLRPFWFRLALTWVPRYLIAIVILGLAIAIHAHVGFEFRTLPNTVTTNTEPSFSIITPLQSADGEDGVEILPNITEQHLSPARKGSLVVSSNDASRRASVKPSVGSISVGTADTIRSISIPSLSQRQQHNGTYTIAPVATYESNQIDKTTSRKPSGDKCEEDPHRNASPLTHCAATNHAQHQLTRNQVRIHRQLRLMFIYPVVYIVMWLTPFIYHCTNYSNYRAAHPVYWLSLAATVCVTSSGAVDCLIFSLRERPWRHIASSDDSFFGSFTRWRTCPDSHHANGSAVAPSVRPAHTLQRAVSEATPVTPHASGAVEPGWLDSVMRAGRSVRMSGSSDYVKMQAELARMRLEIEKQERRAAMGSIESLGQESGGGGQTGEGSVSAGERERKKRNSSRIGLKEALGQASGSS